MTQRPTRSLSMPTPTPDERFRAPPGHRPAASECTPRRRRHPADHRANANSPRSAPAAAAASWRRHRRRWAAATLAAAAARHRPAIRWRVARRPPPPRRRPRALVAPGRTAPGVAAETPPPSRRAPPPAIRPAAEASVCATHAANPRATARPTWQKTTMCTPRPLAGASTAASTAGGERTTAGPAADSVRPHLPPNSETGTPTGTLHSPLRPPLPRRDRCCLVAPSRAPPPTAPGHSETPTRCCATSPRGTPKVAG
eukprot:ctg_3678.g576